LSSILLSLDPKGFWWWCACVSLGITWGLDFVQRPDDFFFSHFLFLPSFFFPFFTLYVLPSSCRVASSFILIFASVSFYSLPSLSHLTLAHRHVYKCRRFPHRILL
jgi:hypothetical protein